MLTLRSAILASDLWRHGDVVQRHRHRGGAAEQEGGDRGVFITAGDLFQKERDGRDPAVRGPEARGMEECAGERRRDGPVRLRQVAVHQHLQGRLTCDVCKVFGFLGPLSLLLSVSYFRTLSVLLSHFGLPFPPPPLGREALPGAPKAAPGGGNGDPKVDASAMV